MMQKKRKHSPHLKSTATQQRSTLPDIKPQSQIAKFDATSYAGRYAAVPVERVAPLVGMSETFIRKVFPKKRLLTLADIIELVEQDSFSETFVPRSKVIDYFLTPDSTPLTIALPDMKNNYALIAAESLSYLQSLPSKSIQCVVTSTPYWGLRIYKDATLVNWADKTEAVYGHEQTPESFVRHTAEILHELFRVLTDNGSIWWNVMDSFNTRTQIRGNAAEALRAMQGKDRRRWSEHDCRRYSAGHAYLKDGEQCLIPIKIAERASRMGFYVKSVITWAKRSTLPEPQETRVSRNLEYVLHLTKNRSPLFHKGAYRNLPVQLGGRNNGWETDKLSDVWTLPTSSGRDGHGAQFPVCLPARCIALSTNKNDVVLDPFVGSGNSGVAAVALGRQFIGIDASPNYIDVAVRKIREAQKKARNTPLSKLAASVAAISDPISGQ